MTMTTAPLSVSDAAVPAAVLRTRPGGNIWQRLRPTRGVLNLVMAIIALFWLLPSFSMLMISFRQAGLFEQSGW